MQVRTRAIVIRSVKYGESDLIVTCFTEVGVRPYLVKGVLKAKSKKYKAAHFQLLNQLDLLANHNDKGRLNSIKELRTSYIYHSIQLDVFKQSIAIFLAEVLATVLQEGWEDTGLFHYLEAAFQWLDNHDHTANFHLVFLMHLSKFLGIFPHGVQNNFPYFDMEDGRFVKYKPSGLHLDSEKLIDFRELIGINFDGMLRLKWNSTRRQEMLDIILTYFELHLPGFRKPRSLKVLKEVFNELS